MTDHSAARNDRLRDTGRWGYTGDVAEDQAPVEQESHANRWVIWLAIAALLVIAAVMLLGPNL
jgi:uncharacterized membrane-anchored protein